MTRAAKESSAIVKQFCEANGQILLPIVNLIESASQEVASVLHQIQMQTLETILTLSAEQVAGARTPGRPSGEIRWHGSQAGKLKLADREVKVKRPRLRHKTEGEVKIPVYEKLRQDRGLQQHMLGEHRLATVEEIAAYRQEQEAIRTQGHLDAYTAAGVAVVGVPPGRSRRRATENVRRSWSKRTSLGRDKAIDSGA